MSAGPAAAGADSTGIASGPGRRTLVRIEFARTRCSSAYLFTPPFAPSHPPVAPGNESELRAELLPVASWRRWTGAAVLPPFVSPPCARGPLAARRLYSAGSSSARQRCHGARP